MQWRFDGKQSVYVQIMDKIRHAVLSGEYGPGDRVPPVRELAMTANVNPNTMQRALMTLEQEHLLIACGANGRFVTDDPQVLEALRVRTTQKLVRECAEKFRSMGMSMEQAAAMLLELDKEEEA